MIRTSRQLKDLIRNMSKEKRTEALILMRNYMMERFLERVCQTEYKDKFILKGGMLIAAMVGVDTRSTMDIDATLKGTTLSISSANNIVNKIISVPLEDGISFYIKNISEIMEDADYSGIRVSIDALFDGSRIPLKIDISTGDIITPHEIVFEIPLMFEDRKIPILAYPLETVLAEKLQSIIVRSVTNTRMRDLYDIYILLKIYGNRIQKDTFSNALNATSKKRGSFELLKNTDNILDEIKNSIIQQGLWSSYQNKFIYATKISWTDVMKSVYDLINLNF